ncbi:MAG: hypothetical protein OIN86_15325 [Candidatus Methanoperedens sp.]|nr:hypothetical protein [Candidatus Methanoperedens sp.]
MGEPAGSYNTLAVGSVDDKNTILVLADITPPASVTTGNITGRVSI